MSGYDVCIKTLIEHVNAFIASQTNSHTAASYKADLRQFGIYIQVDKGHNEPLVVTERTIRDFIAKLTRESYSSASVARKGACIRSFFKYLVREKIATDNPASKVHPPRVKRKPLKTLSPNIIEDLVRSVQGDWFSAQRDRAVLMLLYKVGLLPSELEKLTCDNIDLKEGTLAVASKKAERLVSLDIDTTKILRRYLLAYALKLGAKHCTAAEQEDINAALEQMVKDGCSPATDTEIVGHRLDVNAAKQMIANQQESAATLFPNKYNGQMTTRSIGRIVEKYAKKSKIENCTPRTLRASCAKQKLRQGKTLEEVGSLLGLKYKSTAERYKD